MSDSLWPHGLYSPRNSLGQNTGVGSLSLPEGIFPTQGLNPGLPHCRWILYQLNHKGSPGMGYLYLPHTSLFSEIWFSNIFPHWGLSCHFLSDVFWWTEVLTLMKSNIHFFFVTYVFGVLTKKPLPSPRSWRFTFMFYSESFRTYIEVYNSILSKFLCMR